MAEVPIYRQTERVQAPGSPNLHVDPVTPAASAAGVYESQAALGKTVEDIGSKLEGHLVLQEKLRQQQEDYATKEAYKNSIQNALSDPQSGLLVKYQGVNAPKALGEYDQLVKGSPAAPGIPGTPSLRAQFMEGKSAYQQKMLEKDFDGIESMYRGKLINHVLAQSEAASKAINEANIDSNLKNGALVTPTSVHGEGGKLVPAITLAEQQMRSTIQNDLYFKKQGHPPEVIAKITQDHIDQLGKIAVETNAPKNWQDAQKILDASSVSPSVRAALQEKVVNGARVDQYTESLTNSVLKNPAFRTPDSQISEADAQTFVHAQIRNQEHSGNPLPPGHADAIVSKVQSQISIENKGVAQRQQLQIAKASNDIWSAQQSGVAPAAAYDKYIKNGKFDNAIERGKADEIFTKVYEKDPSALDSVWAHMSEPQKATIAQITNSKEFLGKFPYAEDRKTFENTLKQKIMEGHIQTPDAINTLYQEQLKAVPTGAPRFWGGFGRQRLPQYETDKMLQQNQPVVKAVGGLAAAEALAFDLGGPSKLAPDTNESKAIMVLARYGKPINASTISTVISKHPDLLK